MSVRWTRHVCQIKLDNSTEDYMRNPMNKPYTGQTANESIMTLTRGPCRNARRDHGLIGPHVRRLLAVILLAGIATAHAGTYYVNPSSGNNSNSGQSESAAWADMTPVASQTSSGDTVFIRNMDESITTVTWPDRIYKAKTVSQFGITWTFNRDYQIGQFANRDMWVLGTVSIVEIDPPSKNVGGRIANGSALNPSPTDSGQGYDNEMDKVSYNGDLNVGYNVSGSNPLSLQEGSLVSTISVRAAGQRPQVDTAAILTVLSSIPAHGSFRPPYSGTDKTIEHGISNLEYDGLRQLQPVPGTPDLSTVERYFERPWIDHRPGYTARYLHPEQNMPDYGRDMTIQMGIGALSLHLNYSNEEKHVLLTRFVQLGIDWFGVVEAGGYWPANGGHASGRKWPILFAGIVLNDADMMSIGEKSGDYLYSAGYGPGNRPPGYIHFGEDDQTFYVTEDDIYDLPYARHEKDGFVYYGHGDPSKKRDFDEYTDAHLGMPEWGIRHATDRNRDGLDWDAPYRRGETGQSWSGFVLAAMLMNAQPLWNHDALFDYQDRYMRVTDDDGEYPGNRAATSFLENMWDAYRASCGDSGDTTAPSVPSGLKGAANSDQVVLNWEASSDSQSSISHYNVYRDSTRAGIAATTSYTDTEVSSGSQYGYYVTAVDTAGNQSAASEICSVTIPDGDTPTDNQPPILATIGNKATNEAQALSFSVSASDADGDTLTYSAGGLPSGASFSSQSFNWTPSYDQSGSHEVTFLVSDGSAQDSETITISVTNVNRAPVLSRIGGQSGQEDELLTFALSASDPDGDTVSYSASGLPSGATLNGETFSWTPTSSQVGSHSVTLAASDGDLQDSETITLTIAAAAPDETAPSVSQCEPEADAIQVPLNNLITLHITDTGKGVDAESVVVRVDGHVVYQGGDKTYESSYGQCSLSGSKADYKVIYQADGLLPFDHLTTVSVDAADLAGNPMTTVSYAFTTEMRAFGNNLIASGGTTPKSQPVTVGDSAGNIHAVWSAGDAGRRKIYATTMAAQTTGFGPSVQVTTDSADHCYPDVALGDDGTLYMVWQDDRNGHWDIYASLSIDGQTWSEPIQVTDSESDETHPAIAVGSGESSDLVYVTWQDDRNSHWDIYVATLTGGFGDGTISRVTSDSADQTEPDIAIDGNGAVYLVWTDTRNGQADLYGASSLSTGWTNVAVVTASSDQTQPALAAERDSSTIHILWVDDAPGDDDIYYVSSEGLPAVAVTGRSIIDDTSDADQGQPSITCHDDAKVFGCWQDWRHATRGNGDSDLFMADLESGSAATNVLIGDDSTNTGQSKPSIGIDGYGNPYLVWTDDRDSIDQIYYAGTTFIDPIPLDSKFVTASEGATVGPDPSEIDEPEDVSIIVPAGACQCDVQITITKILNPQALPVECLGSYDFGPSGIDFDEPVTLTIPYHYSGDDNSAKPYWYDSLTGALSQQGITDIKNLVISDELNALQFKTTHFTPFYLVVDDPAEATDEGGGGGGGCSVSTTGGSSPADMIVPYGIIAMVMVMLRRRDRRKSNVSSGV